MQSLGFFGGIHPPAEKKRTQSKSLEIAKAFELVYIPLSQHIGAPCTALVKAADLVKKGQKIGEASGFVSAPVHSSVSGKVKGIQTITVPIGQKVSCIVIENDFQETVDPSIHPYPPIETMEKGDILKAIQEAGIVGMGGATFPTHVKLSPPKEKPIDVVILNGAECEPYLTADHRLMLEQPEDIIYGMKAIMKILGVTNGFIGIEDNKPDCIKKMQEVTQGEKEIRVVSLHTKYPQGAEKQLIRACTNREVPSGGLPMDVGAVVDNVATAAQIGKTLKTGLPLIERICTVTGSIVKDPKNLVIKVGTLYSELIDECGGLTEEAGKIISGGPMMGLAQASSNVAATKGSSGILCLSKKEGELPEYSNCIRCCRCVNICPARINPLFISAYSLKGDYSKAMEYRALDCIECGSCSYICPARRPLVHSIRVAKQEILAKKRREAK